MCSDVACAVLPGAQSEVLLFDPAGTTCTCARESHMQTNRSSSAHCTVQDWLGWVQQVFPHHASELRLRCLIRLMVLFQFVMSCRGVFPRAAEVTVARREKLLLYTTFIVPSPPLHPHALQQPTDNSHPPHHFTPYTAVIHLANSHVSSRGIAPIAPSSDIAHKYIHRTVRRICSCSNAL